MADKRARKRGGRQPQSLCARSHCPLCSAGLSPHRDCGSRPQGAVPAKHSCHLLCPRSLRALLRPSHMDCLEEVVQAPPGHRLRGKSHQEERAATSLCHPDRPPWVVSANILFSFYKLAGTWE